MSYSVDQVELSIRDERKRIDAEFAVAKNSAIKVLTAWGSYRDNEVNNEVGASSSCTSRVKSGDALEVRPEIPHIVLTETEIEYVGEVVNSLKAYDQYCLKQRFSNKNKRIMRSRHFREHLNKAVESFARNY